MACGSTRQRRWVRGRGARVELRDDVVHLGADTPRRGALGDVRHRAGALSPTSSPTGPYRAEREPEGACGNQRLFHLSQQQHNAAPFGDTGGQRGVNACRRGIGCTSRSWNAFGSGSRAGRAE